MSSNPTSPRGRPHRTDITGAVSALVWIAAGILLIANQRTAPGSGSPLRTIGMSLSLLVWTVLVLTQMHSLVRRRVGSGTVAARRLTLATRILAGLAASASALALVRVATGPVPLPDPDVFWTLTLVTALALVTGELLYFVACLFAPLVPLAEGTDPQLH